MKIVSLCFLISSLSFASLLPRLLSLEVDKGEVEAGGKLFLNYTFQNVGSDDEADYRVFVHARIKGTDEGFGGDFSPFYPTPRWRRGEIIKESSVLEIPSDARKGEYVLYIGFYNDQGRIEMDNKEIEREGLRYEVLSFRIGEKSKGGKREVHFKKPLRLEGVSLRERKLYLENEWLKVGLLENYPLIREVRDKQTGEMFTGSDVDGDFQIEMIAPGGEIKYVPSPRYRLDVQSKKESEGILYILNVSREGKRILRLEVKFELRGKDLIMAWGNVSSAEYRLASLRLPLISLAKGKMVLPLMEGRLVDCANAFPHREILGVDCWRSPLTYSCIYGDKGLALLELDSPEDKVWGEVRDNKGVLGVIFNSHTKTTPSLFLQSSSRAILHFLRGDWISAAHFVLGSIKGGIKPIYKNAIVYKIFCDIPQIERPATTFEEALEIIRRFYHFTGGMLQIVYLVGWQYRGHDTGYPAIDKVNERIGGREALLRLMEEARKYNAIVSFHDNYDDAYMDSPAWNKDFICRLPNGDLVKGGVWAGGQSYIINPKRYVEGGYAKHRIEETFQLYPIRGSYHIDVLSAAPLRYSYSVHTCTGKESVEYKKKIVEMFRERGVDVTSEGVTQPFLGFISYFWHLASSDDRAPGEFFSAEERIPFIPACIHGKAVYGQRGYRGGVPSMDVSSQSWGEFLRLVFLEALPSLLFVDEKMEDFKEGKVYYRSGWWSADDEVVYKGRVIRKGGNVFIPRSEDKWLLYSDEGGVVEWDMPQGWKALEIFRVYGDGGKEKVNYQLIGGRFRFVSERQGVYEVVKG